MHIEKRWLTASEAAQYLKLNPKSVYRACQARKLPYVKLSGIGVRIDKHWLDSLLERESLGPGNYEELQKRGAR